MNAAQNTAEKNAEKKGSLELKRHFTREGIHPYDEIKWELRTARVGSPGAEAKFEQHGVEVPEFWSQNATNIVAEKYFAYGLDDPRRESSVRELIDRVVKTIADEGERGGYFAADEREVFEAELTYILVHQKAAFNSPVWFNVGVEGAKPQCSACFILSVKDSLNSISQWMTDEMVIFKRGSGSGVNLSRLRGSDEPLSLGGTSSGPVTFMRGADANAGTIKSGGATRRAAKMVVLDIDHPDIEDFTWCKAREEDRIKALRAAGFELGFGDVGERNLAEATAYQNANNSVRVSHDFLKAYAKDTDWNLLGRIDGKPVKSIPARKLMRDIAEAAWRCGDPGVQYDTTINEWHTTPNFGRINASNPCSEYMHVDDSSCNLASLNLMAFLRPDGSFDTESYLHTVRIMILAQEITVFFGYFPTRQIAKNTRLLRQLGLGYANLGALLMTLGLPYDSDEGRAYAAVLTAIMTGEAYLQSTRLAERVGPFEAYADNAEPMGKVMRKHRAALRGIDRSAPAELLKAAKAVWDMVVARGEQFGFRNAQATVIAPTGTISFLMDCDTTGGEPDFSLYKSKQLAGGGAMEIPNSTLPRALGRLGYDSQQVQEIVDYTMEKIDKGGSHTGPRGSVVGAPHMNPGHYPIFDTAVGERAISPMGHLKMMAAQQPFISGAISKTCNLPESASVDEIEQLYVAAGEMGIKALAIYRDKCKAFQPLGDSKVKREPEVEKAVSERQTSILGDGLLRGERRRVPRNAEVRGVEFKVAGTGGFIHARLFEDGRPGGVFIELGQAGSTLTGFIKALSVTMSLALQHGTPLDIIVSKLVNIQFEPYGFTDDEHIRQAKSLVDYVVKWLAFEFLDLDLDVQRQLGINTSNGSQDSSTQEIIPAVELHAETRASAPVGVKRDEVILSPESFAPFCPNCGSLMQPTGACWACSGCGYQGGCG